MATILIVDDDSNNRLLVATLLEHAGHVVLEAPDAQKAFKLVDEREVGLILVDLSLPGLSGTEFIRRLRGDARHVATPTVLYTGTPQSHALQDFMQAYDVRGTIPKPSEPQAFIRAVQSALER